MFLLEWGEGGQAVFDGFQDRCLFGFRCEELENVSLGSIRALSELGAFTLYGKKPCVLEMQVKGPPWVSISCFCAASMTFGS